MKWLALLEHLLHYELDALEAVAVRASSVHSLAMLAESLHFRHPEVHPRCWLLCSGLAEKWPLMLIGDRKWTAKEERQADYLCRPMRLTHKPIHLRLKHAPHEDRLHVHASQCTYGSSIHHIRNHGTATSQAFTHSCVPMHLWTKHAPL